jgi:hypothetical protein
LAVKGKILTWDVLQSRGREGPGMCYLCKSDLESIDHIFIHCAFTKAVWEKIITRGGYKHTWSGRSLEICIQEWFENKSVPTVLAAHLCWNIWLERNLAIFEGSMPKIQKVYYKTLIQASVNEGVKRDKLPKSLLFHLQDNTTIAYFDGAAHQSGAYCGAGGVLKLPDLTCIRWTFNVGQGTNTKAELLGAWAAIRLALHLSIRRLHLVGDSKVVIAWLDNKGSLKVCAIEGWKSRLKEMVKDFELH